MRGAARAPERRAAADAELSMHARGLDPARRVAPAFFYCFLGSVCALSGARAGPAVGRQSYRTPAAPTLAAAATASARPGTSATDSCETVSRIPGAASTR
ncbi:hypothetical protein SAVIM40S_06513 [Streptomyces avidinii]